jgi:hypothetical protein
MFLPVRTVVPAIAALTAIVLLVPGLGQAAPRPIAPSRSEIRAAARAAVRSSGLWATVNICNTKRDPDAIGVRGQMPGLGFRTRLGMEFQIRYWSARERRFRLIGGADKSITVGSATSGLHQDGATFHLTPHAGFIVATVSFTWSLGQMVLVRVTRWTRSGHPDADGGDPPRYSAGKCVIS